MRLNPPTNISELMWPLKMATKICLARIPLDYAQWNRLGIFKHGKMLEPEYAHGVVKWHIKNTGRDDLEGLHVLELGPGDTLSSAVIGAAFGAVSIDLVDVSAFAHASAETYIDLARQLRVNGAPNVVTLDDCRSVDDIMKGTNASYHTGGLSSLRGFRDESVDFLWSHAVLEHVRGHEFDQLLAEQRRILAPDGVCSHQIDLRDHLAGGLNNLRFSERVWEAEWMVQSGFYTNRIRFGEMLTRFTNAGFDVNVTSIQRWPALPLLRHRMDEQFQTIPDDDLRVCSFGVVLRPR